MDNIKIDISELRDITCECGETAFQQAFHLKYLPALQSPTGKPTTITLAGFVCLGCNTWFNLKEWADRELSIIDDDREVKSEPV